MDGKRFANIDLPLPGAPIMMALCPPAAATSRARFTFSCPLTSEKSNIINDKDISINIYPNPTKDKLFVESSEEVQSVKIYSISGSLILNTRTTYEINLSDLNLGLYFVEIQTENTIKYFEIIKEQ